MRSKFGLLLLLALNISVVFGQRTLPKPTATASLDDVRSEILKLEDANNNARINGDGKVLKSLYAADFAGVNATGGSSDKPNIVDYYSGDGSVLAVNSTDDVKVRVLNNAAIVTARLKYQYNSKMENQAVRWLRYTRVYEKRSIGWQVVAEHFSFTDDPTKK